MIEFVLTACLLTNPSVCETGTHPVPQYTLIQCMTGAQILATEWEAEHSDWSVAQHRCRVSHE
ncbi:hypothetical protein SAMN04488011_104395 [Palleronia pelagia]|uniref:Uncharacterized protein n=1 Tax=Palleronia pelagia TaxID=387096 RepID=A0A1H8HDU7_9RHOB|nr:hypothetical protein SAMN04488011_104395 [Palleronia pelagia]